MLIVGAARGAMIFIFIILPHVGQKCARTSPHPELSRLELFAVSQCAKMGMSERRYKQLILFKKFQNITHKVCHPNIVDKNSKNFPFKDLLIYQQVSQKFRIRISII